MSNWCTIESDPGVFTELISAMGVKGVQVEELVSLDTESLNKLKPCYGLIFLFKWQKEDNSDRPVLEEGVDGVFFAQQVITNACATQAIISILLNRDEIELGEDLSQFKKFTVGLPPEFRGLAISNSPQIREAHNSFARPEPFIFESKGASEDDDAFHFVSYVPVDGNLYELDGLQAGPILLDDCTKDNWVERVVPLIQQRIQRYSQKEIRFNLLALVKDRKEVFKGELAEVETKTKAIQEKLASLGSGMDTAEDGKDELPNTKGELETLLVGLGEKGRTAKENLAREEEKYRKWNEENIRRKHNYVPFIFNFLKILAKKGKLDGLVAAAEEDAKKRAEQKQAEKK